MRKYLYLILLIISSIVSISCSDTNENKRDTIILSKSEKEIYKDIEIASLKKIVSIENSNKAKTKSKKICKERLLRKELAYSNYHNSFSLIYIICLWCI